jgi:c-di-GMP-binding flagellar brake protein YcgR
MSDLIEERRRTARMTARDGFEMGLGRPHAVRLMEISMTGALLRTSHSPPVGERGELRTKLGDHTFAVQVEIRRVVLQPGQGELPGRYSLGVTFVSLDAENRRCLERFLRQPATP